MFEVIFSKFYLLVSLNVFLECSSRGPREHWARCSEKGCLEKSSYSDILERAKQNYTSVTDLVCYEQLHSHSAAYTWY